jgi:hypothetical protein
MRVSHFLLIVFLTVAVNAIGLTADFADNKDGTVSERSSGLIWQQGDAGPMSWVSAMEYCAGLALAAKDGWRLPTPKELFSLVDHSKRKPAVDTKLFPVTNSSFYWASLIYSKNSDFAWGVFFDLGYLEVQEKNKKAYTRCVNDGRKIEKWSE